MSVVLLLVALVIAGVIWWFMRSTRSADPSELPESEIQSLDRIIHDDVNKIAERALKRIDGYTRTDPGRMAPDPFPLAPRHIASWLEGFWEFPTAAILLGGSGETTTLFVDSGNPVEDSVTATIGKRVVTIINDGPADPDILESSVKGPFNVRLFVDGEKYSDGTAKMGTQGKEMVLGSFIGTIKGTSNIHSLEGVWTYSESFLENAGFTSDFREVSMIADSPVRVRGRLGVMSPRKDATLAFEMVGSNAVRVFFNDVFLADADISVTTNGKTLQMRGVPQSIAVFVNERPLTPELLWGVSGWLRGKWSVGGNKPVQMHSSGTFDRKGRWEVSGTLSPGTNTMTFRGNGTDHVAVLVNDEITKRGRVVGSGHRPSYILTDDNTRIDFVGFLDEDRDRRAKSLSASDGFPYALEMPGVAEGSREALIDILDGDVMLRRVMLEKDGVPKEFHVPLGQSAGGATKNTAIPVQDFVRIKGFVWADLSAINPATLTQRSLEEWNETAPLYTFIGPDSNVAKVDNITYRARDFAELSGFIGGANLGDDDCLVMRSEQVQWPDFKTQKRILNPVAGVSFYDSTHLIMDSVDGGKDLGVIFTERGSLFIVWQKSKTIWIRVGREQLPLKPQYAHVSVRDPLKWYERVAWSEIDGSATSTFVVDGRTLTMPWTYSQPVQTFGISCAFNAGPRWSTYDNALNWPRINQGEPRNHTTTFPYQSYATGWKGGRVVFDSRDFVTHPNISHNEFFITSADEEEGFRLGVVPDDHSLSNQYNPQQPRYHRKEFTLSAGGRRIKHTRRDGTVRNGTIVQYYFSGTHVEGDGRRCSWNVRNASTNKPVLIVYWDNSSMNPAKHNGASDGSPWKGVRWIEANPKVTVGPTDWTDYVPPEPHPILGFFRHVGTAIADVFTFGLTSTVIAAVEEPTPENIFDIGLGIVTSL